MSKQKVSRVPIVCMKCRVLVRVDHWEGYYDGTPSHTLCNRCFHALMNEGEPVCECVMCATPLQSGDLCAYHGAEEIHYIGLGVTDLPREILNLRQDAVMERVGVEV